MGSLEDEFAFSSPARPPKCLAGVSIMLVDDSRSVSEAVRMMATVSGARIRRADCIASAQRHVMLFRPNVVLVDLGLPDGNGVEVAQMVAEKVDPKPGILILSAAEEDVAKQAAQDCGADGYLLKPIESLGAFQAAILEALPGGGAGLPDWNSEFNTEMLGTDFYTLDLENALDLFEEAVREDASDGLAFGAQFLAGVAGTASDKELEQCARAVSDRLAGGHRGLAAAGIAIDMLTSRLSGEMSATG